MLKYRLAIWSAVFNLFGTLFLFYSFQATSTDFILVTTKEGKSALCVGDRALFTITQDGGLGIGTKCPDHETGKPTAVVNTKHPRFVTTGFIFILLGFLMQCFSIENPQNKSFKNKEKQKKLKQN